MKENSENKLHSGASGKNQNGRIWRGLGAKVTGASHTRQERPCQDAIRIETYGEYLVAAVADGHGSDTCPFSGEGSQAAVDCIHDIFAKLFEAAGTETKSVIENTMEIRLPKQLSSMWRQCVEDIHKSACRDEDFLPILYGTTVLAVAASPEFVFAIQLGDGDILAVDDEPHWLVEPEYMPGNETYSLCMPDCWRYIRTHLIHLNDERKPPELIMLTTDGYANSFMTQEGFTKAGNDILTLLVTEGAEYVTENLEEWLSRSSNEGSGDDIAMALVY